MTTRDFSDKALGDIMTKYYSSIMAGQFDSEVSDDFYEHYGFRYSGRDDSYEASKRKQEYYDTMVDALKGIFNSARQYDTDISPSFHPLQEGIDNISNIMASLSGSISRKSPHHGLWRIPAEKLAASLESNSQALVGPTMRRFEIRDENGNVVDYDWDEMERVMRKDAKGITAVEYMALARLYSQMGEEDMAKFAQRLAEPGEKNNVPHGKYRPFNTWTFDEVKIAFLRVALVMVYDENGQTFTDNARAHLSVLDVLPYLGYTSRNGTYTGSLGVMAEEFGTDYPSISISIKPDGEVFILYPVGITVTEDGSDVRKQSTGVVIIPAPQAADLATGDLTALMNDDLRERFNSDNLAAPVVYSVLSFVPYTGIAAGIISLDLMIQDYDKGQQLIDRSIANGKVLESIASVYGQFDYDAAVVTLPDGSAKVLLYPGEKTAEKIGELNSALDKVTGLIRATMQEKRLGEDINKKILDSLHDAERLKIELGYPITEQDLLDNPQKIIDLRQALDGAKLL